jgi:hypothetical protein
MSRLDLGDHDVHNTLRAIVSDDDATNWAVFEHVPRSNNRLKLSEKGEDGFDELLDEINEGKVQFYYVRFEVGGLPKYVYIPYCGEGVTGMLRGNFHNHTIDLSNYIKDNGMPIHVTINARNDDEFDEDEILKQLGKAIGSNYDAGQVNQGITEEKLREDRAREDQERASERQRSENSRQEEIRRMQEQNRRILEQQAASKIQEAEKVKQTAVSAETKLNQIDQNTESNPLVVNMSYDSTSQVEANKRILEQQEAERQREAERIRQSAVNAETKLNQIDQNTESKPLVVERTPPQTQPPSYQPSYQPPSNPPPTNQPPSQPPGVPPKSQPPSNPPPTNQPPSQPPSVPPKSQPPSNPPPTNQPPSQPPSVPPKSQPPSNPPPSDLPPSQPPQQEYQEEYQEEYYGEEYYEEEYYEQVIAKYDFEGQREGDLSFVTGDIITVYAKDEGGWWHGALPNGVEGYFPCNFIEEYQ